MGLLPEQFVVLHERFAGRQVEVCSGIPAYARFLGKVGQVKGVNWNGRVLVQFEGEDRAWYDLPPEVLRIVNSQDPSRVPAEDPASRPTASWFAAC